jgi:osmotically-inducible protein OsmY
MSEPVADAASAEQITDDIDHVVGHSWFFDPQTIHVSVEGGAVTLSGTVRSQRERRMAAAAAWAHEGVVEVENDLQVV